MWARVSGLFLPTLLILSVMLSVQADAAHWVIRVPVPRGGFGDVAAGYLVARDLRERLGFTGEITLVGERGAREIIEAMGIEPLRRHGIELRGSTELADRPPIDVLIEVALKNSRVSVPNRFFRFAPGGVRLSLPVFESSEVAATTSLGHLVIEDDVFEFPAPGPGLGSSGIYPDSEALRYRRMSNDEVFTTVVAALEEERDTHLAQFLKAWRQDVNKPLMMVAYGMDHQFTHSEGIDLVRALVAEAKRLGRTVVMVTPLQPNSAWVPHLERSGLSNDVRTVDVADFDHAVLASAPLVRLVSGKLSHRVFTGLLALSERPFLISGDGAISGAITLGRPFTLARVPWNVVVYRAFMESLRQHADTETVQAMATYEAARSFDEGLRLFDNRALFEANTAATPLLSDSIVAAVNWMNDPNWMQTSGLRKLPVVFALKRLWSKASMAEVWNALQSWPDLRKREARTILEKRGGRFGFESYQRRFFLRALDARQRLSVVEGTRQWCAQWLAAPLLSVRSGFERQFR